MLFLIGWDILDWSVIKTQKSLRVSDFFLIVTKQPVWFYFISLSLENKYADT